MTINLFEFFLANTWTLLGFPYHEQSKKMWSHLETKGTLAMIDLSANGMVCEQNTSHLISLSFPNLKEIYPGQNHFFQVLILLYWNAHWFPQAFWIYLTLLTMTINIMVPTYLSSWCSNKLIWMLPLILVPGQAPCEGGVTGKAPGSAREGRVCCQGGAWGQISLSPGRHTAGRNHCKEFREC